MTVSMSKRSIAPGSIVPFGMYPQTASGIDRTPIEWLMLDVQDGKALLLSYKEANEYLGVTLSSDTPKAIVHPTGYAILQGAIEDEEYFSAPRGEAAGSWWLKQSTIGSQCVYKRQSGSPACQFKHSVHSSPLRMGLPPESPYVSI